MKYHCINHADRPGVVEVGGDLLCWECYLPDGPLKTERCRQYQTPAANHQRVSHVRRIRPAFGIRKQSAKPARAKQPSLF